MPIERKFEEDDDLAPFLSGAASRATFDEKAYLAANPDVADALARGAFASAYEHYERFGKKEGRHVRPDPSGPARPAAEPMPVPDPPAHSIDAVVSSDRSGVFIVGWANDVHDGIESISVKFGQGSITFLGEQLVRCRRRDVETATGLAGARSYGFCAFGLAQGTIRNIGSAQVDLKFRNGGRSRHSVGSRGGDDASLRDTALDYFFNLDFFGNKYVESFCALDHSFGEQIVRQNELLSGSIAASASAFHYGGKSRKKPRGSIIVCLYGKHEFVFLQNALFSAAKSAGDYEFIYVCNSPDLLEILHKEATICRRIYGLNMTIVALTGNAGFGAANNAAARFAKSERLLIVNPDIFPFSADWGVRHSQLIESAPAKQTKLFGVPLFYSDRTLMHAGMYFETDSGVSVDEGGVRRRPMLRVHHYGKGAAPDLAELRQSRPVSAITGAFMSVDREVYESVQGFSEKYIFGHYEDADLCLKAIEKGVIPWIHDIPFWHLEGKGGKRLPHHEGASIVNRWLFTNTWYERINAGLLGRDPESLRAG